MQWCQMQVRHPESKLLQRRCLFAEMPKQLPFQCLQGNLHHREYTLADAGKQSRQHAFHHVHQTPDQAIDHNHYLTFTTVFKQMQETKTKYSTGSAMLCLRSVYMHLSIVYNHI